MINMPEIKPISEETAQWLIKVMGKMRGEEWTEQENISFRLYQIDEYLSDLFKQEIQLREKIETAKNRWYVRSSIKEFNRLLSIIHELEAEKKEFEARL